MKLKLFSTILIIIFLLSSCTSCYSKTPIKEGKESDITSIKVNVPYNENVFTFSCLLSLIYFDEEILSFWEQQYDKEWLEACKKIFPKYFECINNPLRIKVKEDLNKIDPKIIEKIKSDTEFIKFNIFHIKLGLMDDAIKLTKDEFLSKYKLLKEFYEEANIHDLYLKYKDDYEKELEKHRKILTEKIKVIRDYLRLEEPEENEIIHVVNFLDFNFGGYYSRV